MESYDAKSRRVKKVTPNATTTFFYDDWNLVEERIAYADNTTSTIRYYWGKDLSGTLQGAGGVGGLLWLTVDGTIYIPCYDNNGNVTRYLSVNGGALARYSYDAFGRLIARAGRRASFFRHRFSTKYFDVETGLYYYGYRFYHPGLMRWLNRDPIEEEGGVNLYQFNLNSPLVSFDTLGEKPISQCKLNGIPISFVFNGVTLTGNGFSTPAVSGRPVKTKRTSWVSTIKILGSPALGGIDSEYTFDYSASRQKLRNEGPLPVGAYWIDVDEKRSAGTSKYSHIILYKAWGSYSWSLHPEAGTQTHGRSGFFIHGGLNWGSAGCIDIKSGDVKFNEFLKGLCKCYIPIIVKYELQQDKKTEREITWHYNLAPYNVPYVR